MKTVFAEIRFLVSTSVCLGCDVILCLCTKHCVQRAFKIPQAETSSLSTLTLKLIALLVVSRKTSCNQQRAWYKTREFFFFPKSHPGKKSHQSCIYNLWSHLGVERYCLPEHTGADTACVLLLTDSIVTLGGTGRQLATPLQVDTAWGVGCLEVWGGGEGGRKGKSVRD